jgi:putative colanic acid biosynthesis UDP-glucose lipid carrier transferase
MDIGLASLALLALAPLLLLVAALVKLSSPGPVFFRQRRYGLDGDEIRVYKFRTMTVTEDGDQIRQATRDDERVTPFGRLLRRYSLDELPQLINVLEGSMSLVGPRPHAVAHNELYRKLIKGYMIRHKVLPGITGLAQVSGCRGETTRLEDMQARVQYDLEYLRHWTPLLDLKIMFRTVALLLSDSKAY